MLEPGRTRWTKPSTILVATDLTDIGRLFPFAKQIAQETGARLILAHILTAVQAIAADPSGLPYYDPAEAIRFAEKGLAPYRTEARNAGLECDILIREGSAAQQIIAIARQIHADRIFLGTRSRGKLGKLLLGSVAEQVLRSVSIPVLTLGPEAHLRAAEAGKSVVLHATTLGRTSGASAALACGIAKQSDSRLVVMHVLPATDATDGFARDLQAGAERELRQLIQKESEDACAAEAFVTFGNPAVEILAKASELNARLILLGASHSGALMKFARDGTVYRILAHAHCPVLTLCDSEQTRQTVERENAVSVGK